MAHPHQKAGSPSEAIKVTNFLASIDYSKCTGCGQCVEVCPKQVIVRA